MSNIDNLTAKIESDANARKDEILHEAELKASRIINAKTEEACNESQLIIRKAGLDSGVILEKAISKAELEMRNKKLEVKQIIIEKVFSKAKEELAKMPAKDFETFVTDSIMNLDIDGDEAILIGEEDMKKISAGYLDTLNAGLKLKGKSGELKFEVKEAGVNGGFILSKNGIEINNTFEDLVNSIKYEVEYEIGKILFN
ncbi:MAG: V-type ATP synthase subunit E [Clostridioides sp.]|jgi:V/A-type H+-transporting ATPase subunit E|nr:V-type ATP synthase subunit E [Clostridioides sp.]